MLFTIPGLLLLTISTSVLPSIGLPSLGTYTVGAHPDCDFPDINTAISSDLTCSLPLVCTPTLLVYQNYYKPALIFINQTINIYGSYDNFCTGTYVENSQSIIDSAGQSSSGKVMYIYPPSGETINVGLKDLVLSGANGNNNIQGGVLVMDPGFGLPGQINLTLQDSLIHGGLSERGGGIYMSGNHNLTIHNSSIFGNRALAAPTYFGDGGGIFCVDGGTIDFNSGKIENNEADSRGGVNSKTIIKNNEVAKITTKNTFGAEGGGIYLRDAVIAILRNVEFIGNEATDEGGISADDFYGTLDIDRTANPCLSSSPEGCSAFIENKSTGFKEAGSGSAISLGGANFSTPIVNIKRTVFHRNYAYAHNGPGGGAGGSSLITLLHVEALVAGNLIFLNAIEDDPSIFFEFFSYGAYLFLSGDIKLLQNTIAFNENSGSVLRIGGSVIAIANLIYEPDQEYGIINNDLPTKISYSACNVTSNELIASNEHGGADVITGNLGFVNSPMANFRLQGDSIANNRCDQHL